MAVISAGGRVRRTNAIFPTVWQRPPVPRARARARLLLYFLRGVPLNTPRRTRLRIQVRRSTYVRLGFRSFAPKSPLPASSSASQNVTGARRFVTSVICKPTLKPPIYIYTVLYNHRIYGLSFIVQLQPRYV